MIVGIGSRNGGCTSGAHSHHGSWQMKELTYDHGIPPTALLHHGEGIDGGRSRVYTFRVREHLYFWYAAFHQIILHHYGFVVAGKTRTTTDDHMRRQSSFINFKGAFKARPQSCRGFTICQHLVSQHNSDIRLAWCGGKAHGGDGQHVAHTGQQECCAAPQGDAAHRYMPGIAV